MTGASPTPEPPASEAGNVPVTSVTASTIIPPSSPQPIQPTQSVYVAITSPYVIQLVAMVGVILYFIIHDNVSPEVFFSFIQVLIGFNASAGAIATSAHLITNAGIQRSAIKAGETVVTSTKGE